MLVSLKVKTLWGFHGPKGGSFQQYRHFSTLKLHIVHSFDMNTRPAIFLTTLPISKNIKTPFVRVCVCVCWGVMAEKGVFLAKINWHEYTHTHTHTHTHTKGVLIFLEIGSR